MAKKLSLVLGIALLVWGLSMAAQQARAATGDNTTELRPVHCGPVVCWQHKVTTTYIRGTGTRVVVWGHHRPSESRSSWNVPAFTDWTLRQAYTTPSA